MGRWIVLITISLFLLGFLVAIDVGVTGKTTENNTGIQTCLNECPTGCAAPEYRICASDGERYCNLCVIGCYGLTKAENSFCESNKVCCSIRAVVPNSVPSYEMLERSECDDIGDNGEPIVGGHKEIVSNSFCVEVKTAESFCGKSSLGVCETDADCIKGGCSEQVCQSKNEEPIATTCEYRNCYNPVPYKTNCLCIENKCKWSKLTEHQIKEINTHKNAITAVKNVQEECPESCTCAGSTMKCILANGREMTIFAGNSGNVMVQVKGGNMTTNVTLYKFEGKLYGHFKNNETKEVKMLPDQVKERIREKVERQLENENISLDDNGTYQYQGDKKARLFFVFPVKIMVRAEVDPTTGEIISLKAGKWWSFLAKDENSEQIVGASCGTVTPGQNDACCQSKEFDVWNSDSQQCEFSQ